MHSREVLSAGGGTLTDTLHLVWAGVAMALFLLTMAFAAAALSGGFRRYTLVSIVLLIAFGALTSIQAPRLATGMPTPWLGAWERVDIGVFLLWVVVFAVLLMRARRGARHER